MASRSTDAELQQRTAAALELLQAGTGSAGTAAELAERYGCSIRQARRYVRLAALELAGEMTPHDLDTEAGLILHRLSLLADAAQRDGDRAAALAAIRAQAQALAQFRRAISAPATRFQLPPVKPAPPDTVPDDCPF